MKRRFTTGLVVVMVALVAGCGESHDATGGDDHGSATTATSPTKSVDDHDSTTANGDHGAGTTTAAAEHDDGDTSHLRIAIADGAGKGDTKPTVPLGSDVTLHVTSDAADTLHIHGYDRELTLKAGKEAVITFTADIGGRFEMELHDANTKVGELTVK